MHYCSIVWPWPWPYGIYQRYNIYGMAMVDHFNYWQGKGLSVLATINIGKISPC